MTGLSMGEALEALGDIDDDAPDAAPVEEKKKRAPQAPATPEPGDADDDSGDADEIEAEAGVSDADADDQGEPEEAIAEGDEETEQAEPDQPAIEPPSFLDATRRESFRALPREAQQMLADHDRAMVADYTRKTQKLAERTKAAETRLLERFGEVMTERETVLKTYREQDWAALAQELSPQDYNAHKAQWERLEREYRDLANTRSHEEAESLQSHRTEQIERLREVAPHLLDGDKGFARQREIAGAIAAALKAEGASDEDITHRLNWLSATERLFVDEALQWRAHKAQLAAKPKLTPKPDAKSQGKAIRPAARAQSSNPANGSIRKTFDKRPTMQNAMSVLSEFDD